MRNIKIKFPNFIDTIPNAMYLLNWNIVVGRERHPYLGGRFIPNIIKPHKLIVYLFTVTFVIFSPILFIIPLFGSLWRITCERRINVHTNKLFLFTSIALPRVVKNTKIDIDNSYWLGYPNILSGLSFKFNFLSVYAVLSFADAIEAYVKAVYSTFAIFFNNNISVALAAIQSYKWYLYGYAALKFDLNTELIFCNTNDLYQPLFDNLPHYNKTLIQHGTMIIKTPPANIQQYRLSEGQGFIVQNLPYKFRSLTKVYSFTNAEFQALKLAVLDNTPECIVVGYPLKIDKSKYIKNSILIIAYYPEHREEETKVLSSLSDSGVFIYVKNHPIVPIFCYDDLNKKYNFTLLSGDIWPDVDLIISYDSTLAREYHSMGYSVIYYDEINMENVREIVLGKLSQKNIYGR